MLKQCVAVLVVAGTLAAAAGSAGATSVGMLIGPGPGQDGWSGGAQSGLTNWSAHSDADGIGEKVVDTIAHSGAQSWHFERGYDSSGAGTPFSPELGVTAGQPSSGATADIFTATFWFKAADEAGDGSKIMIAGGTPAGTDRSSNYLEIENVAGAGVTVRTYDGVIGGDWGATELLVATGLSTTEWHKIEMTGLFSDGTYNDSWTYSVDDGALVVGGAYFETARDNFVYGYEMTTRLKFQPKHANYSADFSGFYFDDISYAAYQSSTPDTPLASWQTGFEATVIPEPVTVAGVLMGLAGLGGYIRRRRMA